MQFTTARRQSAPRIGRVALRQGFIWGPLNGVVSSLLTVVAATVLTAYGGFLTLLSFPIAWIFFALAGLVAAREVGRAVSGTLAGLWTGLVSKILSTLLVAIFYLFFQLPRLTGRPVPISRLAPFFLLEALYLLADVVLGIGFGTLGGLIGRRGAKEQLAPSVPIAIAEPSRSAAYEMPNLSLEYEYTESLPPPPSPTPVPPAMEPDSYPYGKPFFPLYEESEEE